ncbi:MAG: BON domain-containing protein [Pirellulaceae bacterium]|jgi:osmotically-inducible protein OsmY|nr:BON domain-containing protein [Pirellulaceae bacterium]
MLQLEDQVYDALHGSQYRALRHLSVECVDGTVTIRGVLNSYFLKQIAQTVVMAVDGVRRVVNLAYVAY